MAVAIVVAKDAYLYKGGLHTPQLTLIVLLGIITINR